jgi:hypothetical protein
MEEHLAEAMEQPDIESIEQTLAEEKEQLKIKIIEQHLAKAMEQPRILSTIPYNKESPFSPEQPHCKGKQQLVIKDMEVPKDNKQSYMKSTKIAGSKFPQGSSMVTQSTIGPYLPPNKTSVLVWRPFEILPPYLDEFLPVYKGNKKPYPMIKVGEKR